MEERFWSAVKSGDTVAIDEMIHQDRSLLSKRNQAGVTAIAWAAYHGHMPLAHFLAKQKGDLDPYECAIVGNMSCLTAHLASSPDVARSFSADGFPLVGLSVFFGQPAIAELLLERGADVNAQATNPTKVRPLHAAVAHRNPDVALRLVRLLLRNGADPNAVQQGGFVPLHEAANRGHLEMVELLLESKANPNSTSDDGMTPVQKAKDAGHAAVVERLLHHMAS